jgi:hypothetical protein
MQKGVKAELHSTVTFAVDWNDWLASHARHFMPKKMSTTSWIKTERPRAALDCLEKREISAPAVL